MAWSPDSQYLTTASDDATARIWNVNTQTTLHILRGHKSELNSIAWSPDGNSIATTSGDNTLSDNTAKIWNASTGILSTTLTGFRNIVNDVAWSPDSRSLITASQDGSAKIWNVENRSVQTTLLNELTKPVWASQWSHDGKSIVTLVGGTATIWRSNNPFVVTTLADPNKTSTTTETVHTDNVWGVAWNRDGNLVATASRDHTIKIWDAMTGDYLKTLSTGKHGVWKAKWSHNGKLIASASDIDETYNDQTVKIFDADSYNAKPLFTHTYHQLSVKNVAWSPDDSRLASVSRYDKAKDNPNVIVWNLTTGTTQTLRGHTAAVWGVAWNPVDPNILATASEDKSVIIWDVATGKPTATITHTDKLWSLDWDAKGELLAIGGSFTIKLWNNKKQQIVRSIDGFDVNIIRSIDISDDGKYILTGGLDKTARIWDAQTGTLLVTLAEHTDSVWDVAWSPDGKYIATGSSDRTAKVWYVPLDLAALADFAQSCLPEGYTLSPQIREQYINQFLNNKTLLVDSKNPVNGSTLERSCK